MKYRLSTTIRPAARVTPGAGARTWDFTMSVKTTQLVADGMDRTGAGTRA